MLLLVINLPLIYDNLWKNVILIISMKYELTDCSTSYSQPGNTNKIFLKTLTYLILIIFGQQIRSQSVNESIQLSTKPFTFLHITIRTKVAGKPL